MISLIVRVVCFMFECVHACFCVCLSLLIVMPVIDGL